MATFIQTLLRRLPAFLLAVCLALPALAQTPQPQELKDYQAAVALKDPAAKLKELERIKAAYPPSAVSSYVEAQILAAKAALAGTLDELLALQQQNQASTKGVQLLVNLGAYPGQLLDHAKVATFDKAKVLAAVKAYRDQARKVAADPAVLAAASEQNREYLPIMANDLELAVAKAQLASGETAPALASLEAYLKGGGNPSAGYQLVRADILEALNRPKEAYEALLAAAVENNQAGLRRARAAYAKLSGKEDGFDALLEARSKELPFHPTPVKPGPAWKGKAVLAELFTGSECPPCVAADFAFDGLLEAYPATALVVLEYHLPIPGPDPMMNPASKLRQDYYGVNSTPTMLFDGQDKTTGGGGRSAAASSYKRVSAKVQERLDGAPGVALKLKAARKGDLVSAALVLGKAPEGVDFHLVLVQAQQDHKGGNKLMVHKMVVRDLVTLATTATTHAFDLAASEKATDAYLTDFEQTSTRFKGFTFPLRRSAISRQGLKVVLFAQERASKRVLQAVIADVE